MRRVRLKRLAYRAASPLLYAWWGVAGAHFDGAKCVITEGDEVLLVRHTYGDRRRWDFPGGFVRRGEEPRAAAAREMGEELGLTVGPDDLAALGALSRRRGRRRSTVSYFGLELAERSVEPDPVELAEVAWFGPRRLPRPLGEYVTEVLERHPLASGARTNPGSPDRG